MKPRLVVEQKLTAFVNQYSVYATDGKGGKTKLVAFAQQKRLALKEKVTFYADASKDREEFCFRAEKAMDTHGRYFVEKPSGQRIGVFKKDFKQSLISSTWHILNKKDEPLLTIQESSRVLAIIRRVGGLLPIVGDVVDLIVASLKYHFSFKQTSNGQIVGKYQKTALLRDHYTLYMKDEAYEIEDWRLFAAIAVALDALQSR